MQTRYWNLQNDTDGVMLREAAALIKQGEAVAFPTETVYGLGADGLNGAAVRKIFEAKGRPNDNPLILHIADKEDILKLTTGLTKQAQLLIEKFWPGPLTVIVAKSSIVPDEVSAGLDTVAVRMPSHPVAAQLIRLAGTPVAAPSANLSGKPSAFGKFIGQTEPDRCRNGACRYAGAHCRYYRRRCMHCRRGINHS